MSCKCKLSPEVKPKNFFLEFVETLTQSFKVLELLVLCNTQILPVTFSNGSVLYYKQSLTVGILLEFV